MQTSCLEAQHSTSNLELCPLRATWPEPHTVQQALLHVYTKPELIWASLWIAPCPTAFARLFAESSHLTFCEIPISV